MTTSFRSKKEVFLVTISFAKLIDIIENVIQDDGGWWTGDLKGKTGVFPGICSA
jgi:hypothetical protein